MYGYIHATNPYIDHLLFLTNTRLTITNFPAHPPSDVTELKWQAREGKYVQESIMMH